MAKEICADCGKVFDGGAHQFFCLDCRKRRLSEAAKIRKLSELGHEARRKKKGERENE